MAAQTRTLAATEEGQLYSAIGSRDRQPSTASLTRSTAPPRLPAPPRGTLRARSACTHENAPAVSQNAHEVALRVHRTGATTLQAPKPEYTIATVVCPVTKVSTPPSVSQSSTTLLEAGFSDSVDPRSASSLNSVGARSRIEEAGTWKRLHKRAMVSENTRA